MPELSYQLAAALAVIGAIALLLRVWNSKSGPLIAGLLPMPRGQGNRLAVISRIGLGPQHTLHLVSLEGRRMLIASHPGGVTLIDIGGGSQ